MQTYLIYFDNHVYLSQSEENKCMQIHVRFFNSATRRFGRQGGDGGKIKWKLSEVNTRAVSRGQDELIGNFKMLLGDVISIKGQVMEYMYIPTGIKSELLRFGMDHD